MDDGRRSERSVALLFGAIVTGTVPMGAFWIMHPTRKWLHLSRPSGSNKFKALEVAAVGGAGAKGH